MARQQGTVRAGIGGWRHPPWRGTCYPSGLPQKRELEYATGQLTTIEVNATFYRTQKPATFARWAAVAPRNFRFSLKAPRHVVNRRDLGRAGDGVARFLASGGVELGNRLGPILWQLPASSSFEGNEFGAFLDLLPELRHPGFACAEAVARCRDAGVAIVHVDRRDYPAMADITADFVYARLQRGDDAIEAGYGEAALDAWAQRARCWATGERPADLACVGTKSRPARVPRDVFVYFIREGKTRAPAAAMALQRRVG